MKTKSTFLITLVTMIIVSCTKEKITQPAFQSQQSQTNSSIEDSLYIGKEYGGGIIFFLDSTKKHGLVAAPVDQGAGSWYNGVFTVTGATSKGLTKGATNTRKIVRSQGDSGTYAAKLCRDYRGGGYDDWYLPSIDELRKLFHQRFVIGGFVTDRFSAYWSSTEWDEYDGSSAYMARFDVRFFGTQIKNVVYSVRAIRKF